MHLHVMRRTWSVQSVQEMQTLTFCLSNTYGKKRPADARIAIVSDDVFQEEGGLNMVQRRLHVEVRKAQALKRARH